MTPTRSVEDLFNPYVNDVNGVSFLCNHAEVRTEICLECAAKVARAYAAAQVAQARAEEREACAKIAADYCTCETLHAGHVGYHAKEIAAAIRAKT